jgi:hypothetical protein
MPLTIFGIVQVSPPPPVLFMLTWRAESRQDAGPVNFRFRPKAEIRLTVDYRKLMTKMGF